MKIYREKIMLKRFKQIGTIIGLYHTKPFLMKSPYIFHIFIHMKATQTLFWEELG